MSAILEKGDSQRLWDISERLVSPFFRVKHWQWLTFFVLTLLGLRLFLALSHDAYLGIDGGAYVLSALEVQGKEAPSVGFPRPPLAPGWLLAPFIEAMGVNAGYKVWTVLFSFTPFIPVYLLTRDLAGKAAAVFAVGFFSVDMMQMEMMVTGSLPLIGFTCIGLALWCMLRLSARWSRLHFWLLAASVGVLPYINQTAAGIAMIVLPLTFAGLFFFVHREKGRMAAGPYQANLVFYVLPAAFIGGLIALGALPWYLANLPGNSELRFPGPLFIFVRWHDPALLLQFPLVCFLVAVLWRTTRDYRVRALTIVMAVLGVMILFLSYDEAVINLLFRPRYFLGLLVYPAIAYILRDNFPFQHSIRKEWDALVPMAAVWLLLLWGQVVIFNLQTGFKDMVLPETAAVLETAKSEHPGKAIITNAYSLSHWVAALNQVESPNIWTLEPSPYYRKSDEHVRCLLGWAGGCDAQASAHALDAGYILIDERIPDTLKMAPMWGAPSEDEWANLPSVPWLTLRQAEGTVKLWEIKF